MRAGFCKDCQFWVLDDPDLPDLGGPIPLDTGTGICHRFPTGAIKVERDWCGEFKGTHASGRTGAELHEASVREIEGLVGGEE